MPTFIQGQNCFSLLFSIQTIGLWNAASTDILAFLCYLSQFYGKMKKITKKTIFINYHVNHN